MLTPEQEKLYSSVLTGLGPNLSQAFGSMLQPQTPENLQDIFQKSYVDPAKQAFEQQIVPSIQQSFGDANAGSSSALNQALAKSASELSTSLGSQYGQLAEAGQNRQLQAISQFLPLLSQQTFSPLIKQKQGIVPGTVNAITALIGAATGGQKK